MNALELFHMLGDVGAHPETPSLRNYRVVTKDGRAVTGIHIDHDKKTVVMVQRDTWIEKRVDV